MKKIEFEKLKLVKAKLVLVSFEVLSIKIEFL